jgi:uncharacterized protein (DUF849 family)
MVSRFGDGPDRVQEDADMNNQEFKILKSAEARRDFMVELNKECWTERYELVASLSQKAKLVGVADKNGGVSGVMNGFDIKDDLKAAGFKWSAFFKTWFGGKEAWAKLAEMVAA